MTQTSRAQIRMGETSRQDVPYIEGMQSSYAYQRPNPPPMSHMLTGVDGRSYTDSTSHRIPPPLSASYSASPSLSYGSSMATATPPYNQSQSYQYHHQQQSQPMPVAESNQHYPAPIYPPHQIQLPQAIQGGTRSMHTTSAHAGYAREDENWTTEPDLAKRRRIQNRLAQRKYRTKLKDSVKDAEQKYAHSRDPKDLAALEDAKTKMTGKASVRRSSRKSAQQTESEPPESRPASRRESVSYQPDMKRDLHELDPLPALGFNSSLHPATAGDAYSMQAPITTASHYNSAMYRPSTNIGYPITDYHLAPLNEPSNASLTAIPPTSRSSNNYMYTYPGNQDSNAITSPTPSLITPESSAYSVSVSEATTPENANDLDWGYIYRDGGKNVNAANAGRYGKI